MKNSRQITPYYIKQIIENEAQEDREEREEYEELEKEFAKDTSTLHKVEEPESPKGSERAV